MADSLSKYDDSLVGKTIAGITKRDMQGRDLHYSDETHYWEEFTITFTDGTSIVFCKDNAELDATSVREVAGAPPTISEAALIAAGAMPADTDLAPDGRTWAETERFDREKEQPSG